MKNIKLYEEFENLKPNEFLKIKSFIDEDEDNTKYYDDNGYGITGYPYVLKMHPSPYKF